MAGTTRLVLDYWQFTTFVLRFGFSYEKQHSVKLFTGTAFRSLSFTSALPKSAELAKAILTTINSAIKKEPIKDSLFMAGLTRLELATFCVTGRHSNQTELQPLVFNLYFYYSRTQKKMQYLF